MWGSEKRSYEWSYIYCRHVCPALTLLVFPQEPWRTPSRFLSNTRKWTSLRLPFRVRKLYCYIKTFSFELPKCSRNAVRSKQPVRRVYACRRAMATEWVLTHIRPSFVFPIHYRLNLDLRSCSYDVHLYGFHKFYVAIWSGFPSDSRLF